MHQYSRQEAESAAEITNANGVQISSKLSVRVREATCTWVVSPPPGILRLPPPLANGDSSTYVCQNVVGLWLKYGVWPLIIRVRAPLKILGAMRRFVDIRR